MRTTSKIGVAVQTLQTNDKSDNLGDGFTMQRRGRVWNQKQSTSIHKLGVPGSGTLEPAGGFRGRFLLNSEPLGFLGARLERVLGARWRRYGTQDQWRRKDDNTLSRNGCCKWHLEPEIGNWPIKRQSPEQFPKSKIGVDLGLGTSARRSYSSYVRARWILRILF